MDKPEYIIHGGDIMLRFKAFQSTKISETKKSKCHDRIGNIDVVKRKCINKDNGDGAKIACKQKSNTGRI